jgi:ketosteroid isomerase-like protein
VSDRLIASLYAAFNARDIDAALALMHPDVAWPNGMEGGYLHGQTAIREYWMRQWLLIDPRVEPLAVADDGTGRTLVVVRQIIRDRGGELMKYEAVHHLYTIEDGLVRGMEIRKP